MDREEILDAVWTLFNHLEDSTSPDLVEACRKLVIYEDFNIDHLPEELGEEVERCIAEDRRDSDAMLAAEGW